jgi:hypothetical protein
VRVLTRTTRSYTRSHLGREEERAPWL